MLPLDATIGCKPLTAPAFSQAGEIYTHTRVSLSPVTESVGTPLALEFDQDISW